MGFTTANMNTAIRKRQRQRKDYIYRRAVTLRDAEIAEKRSKLRASLASGKPLDPSIANDKKLREDYKYDESKADLSANDALDLDDEYAQLSGIVDPRVLVTTSRDPSTRLSSFAKEIRLLLPTSIRLNRGNLILPNLVSSAQASGLSDIVLLPPQRRPPPRHPQQLPRYSQRILPPPHLRRLHLQARSTHRPHPKTHLPTPRSHHQQDESRKQSRDIQEHRGQY